MNVHIERLVSIAKAHRTISSAALLVLVFVSYLFTAKWGLALNAVSGFATLVWPPTGIALAALLIFGYRLWPAIFLAACAVNFLTGAAFPVAFGIALGNTLEAVVGVFLLRRVGFSLDHDTTRNTLLFVLCGVLCNTLLSATIGTSSLWLGQTISLSAYPSTWLAWWVGDMLGALTIGYALLNFRKLILRSAAPFSRIGEALAFTLCLIAFSGAIFLDLFEIPGALSTVAGLVYLTSFFFLWAALRFGTIGASFAIVGVSAIAVAGTVLGTGPFIAGSLSDNLLLLQIYVGSMAVTTMVLASAVEERASEALERDLRLRDRGSVVRKRKGLPVVAELSMILLLFLAIIGVLLSLNVFGMQTLSSIRAYVGGEGLWSKSQKDAVYQLRVYAHSRKEEDFARFAELLRVPLGDKKARIELQKDDPNFTVVEDGFLEGKNDPADTRGMALLFRRFQHVSYFERAIAIWETGDERIIELVGLADMLHGQVAAGAPPEEIDATLAEIDALNAELTVLEDDFSATLGEAARWVTRVMIVAMIAIAALLLLPSLAISLFIIRNIGRLDRAKTEFISLTSHQLRTPPTGIKWYAGMLLEGDLGVVPPEQRKYLEQIAYNNQRMIDVVDSVLNISQIELGEFRNAPTSTDICALIRKIVSELEFQMNDKELEFSMRFECGSQPIMIDPTLVRIVIQNLLVNAITYTPRGGEISFAADVKDEKLTLTIADSGRGIPKEDFPNIFSKFFRAGNAQDSGHSGTGLGLYIVRSILDQIGGTIGFSSAVGRGTTFFVSLPLAQKRLQRKRFLGF